MCEIKTGESYQVGIDFNNGIRHPFTKVPQGSIIDVTEVTGQSVYGILNIGEIAVETSFNKTVLEGYVGLTPVSEAA